MKNAIGKIFFVLFAIILTSKLIYADDIEKIFKVNKNHTIEINLNYGNVNIFTWDKDETKILAKNVNSNELNKLTIEQKGDIVKMEFKGEDSQNFSAEVWIPKQFNLNAKTGGGNVKLNDVISGRVSVSTAGGNISTSAINGRTNLSTSGGNISCADINGDIDVSTGGGDIKLGNVSGKTAVSTSGGNIKIGDINLSAEISTAGGNINVGVVNGHASVSTSGGNIKLSGSKGNTDVSTSGGNINLESADGKVEVSSGAGNLMLKNIKGSISASTGSGTITAYLQPDGKGKSDLNAGVGSIVLYVPENVKATIIAKVPLMKLDGNKNEPENIKSDFEPATVLMEGDYRQTVVTYLLNGGGSIIELSTGMGKIEIKKK